MTTETLFLHKINRTLHSLFNVIKIQLEIICILRESANKTHKTFVAFAFHYFPLQILLAFKVCIHFSVYIFLLFILFFFTFKMFSIIFLSQIRSFPMTQQIIESSAVTDLKALDNLFFKHYKFMFLNGGASKSTSCNVL